VEVGDPTAAGIGLQKVGEPGLDPGAAEDEGERVGHLLEVAGEAGGVPAGLVLDTGERHARLLGLQDADGLLVDEQHVVRRAVPRLEADLADRDPLGGVEVGGAQILHRPAGGGQLGVDRLPGLFFGLHPQTSTAQATAHRGARRPSGWLRNGSIIAAAISIRPSPALPW
jgi:hypothetical protein